MFHTYKVTQKTVIKNKITSFRKSIGFKKIALADKLKVSRKTIYNLESGKSVPSLELALKLAAFFDTSVDNLFQLKNEIEYY